MSDHNSALYIKEDSGRQQFIWIPDFTKVEAMDYLKKKLTEKLEDEVNQEKRLLTSEYSEYSGSKEKLKEEILKLEKSKEKIKEEFFKEEEFVLWIYYPL